MIGHMKKGESVLIHSGSGGVGQAAISICLHAGCTVYTTVGTEEKREFIKKRFPQVFEHPFSLFKGYSFYFKYIGEIFYLITEMFVQILK
jgi:fatty acid synthase